ncbi:MAG: hypothetical protein ACTSQQ_07960 [Candidatus Helarchaeota archaeon]
MATGLSTDHEIMLYMEKLAKPYAETATGRSTLNGKHIFGNTDPTTCQRSIKI